MYTLYEDLPRQIDFKGSRYTVNLAFDVVLACLAIRENTELPDECKVALIAEKLIPKTAKLPLAVKAEMVAFVFKDLVFFQKRSSGVTNGYKSFDFFHDADLIYSSFLQAYGVDLIDEQGHMHWWKFCSLFAGLPQDTKMREVMSIRGRKLPAPTKHNREELQSLMELKRYYALPGAPGERSYQTGLQELWTALERQAISK